MSRFRNYLSNFSCDCLDEIRVMEGEKSLPVYSPEFMVKTPTFKKAVPLLPPITLFHGTNDYSIPHEARYGIPDFWVNYL
jgi:hypothetical protein